VDVGDAVEAVEVPLVAPGSRVLTPEVTLPLGLTFEGASAARATARASAPRTDSPAPMARPRARQALAHALDPAPCAAHTDSTGRPSKREVAGAARERPSRPAAPAAAADPGSSGAAETDDGRLLVVEVAAGGNAERAGVRVGDLLRGTTAARTQMEYPTANLMFGGARARAGSLVTRGARLRVAQRSCQAGLPLHLIGQCRGAQAGRPGTGALRARRC